MESPATTDVSVRVSPELKQEAERVFGVLGLSLSDGIHLFLCQVAKEKAIPFEIRVPNAATLAAVREARTGAVRFDNFNDMLEELDEKGKAGKGH